MTLMRWKPVSGLANWTRTPSLFEEAFDSMFPAVSSEENGWMPRVDITDDKDSIHIHAEVPGMKKEDVKVTFENGLLSISGERKREEKKEGTDYYRIERRYGSFARSFRLPEEVQPDKIQASYKDGILQITLPKAEEKKPREIEISLN